MKIVYSDKHKLRDAQYEVAGGLLVYPFERPARIEYILNRLSDRGFKDLLPPKEFGLETVKKIHTDDFINFLSNGYAEWKAEGYKGDMAATAWPARRMVSDIRPKSIDGRLSYHALSAETMIDKGTWEAAQASKDVALTGADMILQGPDKIVFSLCRPPGHHATGDMFGGYCFLNNAAIAAQYMRDKGAKKVAVLDVDFHHGNGIQDIFYNRDDVLYVSLHGEPENTYPFFMGYANEKGAGAGVGANINYPMPPKTKYDVWGAALLDGLKNIQKFGAEVLIVSLGTDTFEKDPISSFKLTSADFITMGRAIAAINLPTLVVMEGGYAIEEIGINVVNCLEGLMDKK